MPGIPQNFPNGIAVLAKCAIPSSVVPTEAAQVLDVINAVSTAATDATAKATAARNAAIAAIAPALQAYVPPALTSLQIKTDLGYTPMDAASLGQANGPCRLGPDGKILANEFPTGFGINHVFTTASQASMLTLAATIGDAAKVTGDGTAWMYAGPDPTVLANWVQITNNNDVTSVNGHNGPDVSLTSNDVPEGATNLYMTTARSNALLAQAATASATAIAAALVTAATDAQSKADLALQAAEAADSLTTPLSFSATLLDNQSAPLSIAALNTAIGTDADALSIDVILSRGAKSAYYKLMVSLKSGQNTGALEPIGVENGGAMGVSFSLTISGTTAHVMYATDSQGAPVTAKFVVTRLKF
jgi:hypothetical protein